MCLGRFNYVIFRKDKYSLVFVPKNGDDIVRIVDNLSRELCFDLMTCLNDQLDAFPQSE